MWTVCRLNSRGLKYSQHIDDVSGKCSLATSACYAAQRARGTSRKNNISSITLKREILRRNMQNVQKVTGTGKIPGGYLHNRISKRFGANTSVTKILHAGEWNVEWGSPCGTCSVNRTSENNMSIIKYLTIYTSTRRLCDENA